MNWDYIAGFFDGEGNISIKKKKNRRDKAYVVIAQKPNGALQQIQDFLEPETFTLEQPKGIEDFLGTKVQFKYEKWDLHCLGKATTNFYSNQKGLKRAEIPLDVRQRILEALP